MTIPEAYALLGLSASSASPSDVRSAFHKYVLRNHPDLVEGAQAKRTATEAMIRLNEAYQTLKAANFPRQEDRDVWHAQHDSGDVTFDRWMEGLDFGESRTSYDPMSELSPMENAILVPIGMALAIGVAFLAYVRLFQPAAGLFHGNFWHTVIIGAIAIYVFAKIIRTAVDYVKMR
jgi:curved DNA-binding protein CbpA